MNFLKKLFSKSSPEKNIPAQQQEQTSPIQTGKGTYIFEKEAFSEYTYTDLTEEEYKNIQLSVNFLKEAFAPLLRFDTEPVNHPVNLDEYLTVWGSSGFGNFMGVGAEQHAAFLSYNFGQYLVENYGMQWKTKSDGTGTQTVVRLESPVELELYPVDSTLRAIQKKDLAIYAGIELQLKNGLEQFRK